MLQVVKRDGRKEDYAVEKIERAIDSALKAIDPAGSNTETLSKEYAQEADSVIQNRYVGKATVGIEDIQDIVQSILKKKNKELAERYIQYREKRTYAREKNSKLLSNISDILNKSSHEVDAKRENANVDGETSMGIMLKMGSTVSQDAFLKNYVSEEAAKAHKEGLIHIHDMDFAAIGTATCCQIDIKELLPRGINTGHGYIREPNSIESASAIACIIIQSNQNDQHGGQSIPALDFGLSKYVGITHIKNIVDICRVRYDILPKVEECIKEDLHTLFERNGYHILDDMYQKDIISVLKPYLSHRIRTVGDFKHLLDMAKEETEKRTYQAMQAMVHNLNTMHCLHPDQKIHTLRGIKNINAVKKMSVGERHALKDLLESLYNKGMTLSEICKDINVGKKTVISMFNYFGLKRRNQSEEILCRMKRDCTCLAK